MQVSLSSAKEECWSGAGEEVDEELLNGQDGIILGKRDAAGAAVEQEFGEEERYFFDHEPHSPGTPASSPCPPSPTTPTLTRSSTSSDCSQLQPQQRQRQQEIQSPPTYIDQQVPCSLPTTTGMTTISPNPAMGGNISDFETLSPEITKRADAICALPVELLVEIFRYALDSEWMYDRFVEVEDSPERDDAISVGFNDLRSTPLEGKDGKEAFCISRVELQLSQVCRMWRSIFMEGYVDIWDHSSISNCLVVTGTQWFHASFPMSISLSHYTHINLTFSNFSQPDAQQDESSQGNPWISEGYDEALFDPPEGANYHDEVPRGKRYGVDSVVYIRVILNNSSDVALDKVFEFIDFPMQDGTLKLITTVNSGSRFFVSERYSKGLMGPVNGGYAHYDDGYRGIEGEEGDGINVVFEINSWMEGYGWEIGGHIGDFSRWIGGGVDLSYQQQQPHHHHQELLVKLPWEAQAETVGPRRSRLSSRIGWRDAVARTFTSINGERNVWAEWDDDDVCCKEGKLCCGCCHQQKYDHGRLEGFEDEQQALRFEILGGSGDGVMSLRRNVVLMLHPFKRVDYGGDGDDGNSYCQSWDQPECRRGISTTTSKTLYVQEGQGGLMVEGSQARGWDLVYGSMGVGVGFGVGVKVLGLLRGEEQGEGQGEVGVAGSQECMCEDV